MAVPEARLRSEDARHRGEQLYQAHCAFCHGTHLDGQGIRQTGFTRPPRDFTDQTWQQSISSRHIFFVIRTGVPGSAMPAWPIFDADETWDLVAYLRNAGKG
jgi:mono/diheme cytochrome c family protein